MRRPRKKHDWSVLAEGTLDLREHALLARFDEVKRPETVSIALDDRQDVMVAVVSRLDAVDGVIELGPETQDVGEVPQARRIGVSGHRQSVLGARQILANHDDRSIIDVGLTIASLG